MPLPIFSHNVILWNYRSVPTQIKGIPFIYLELQVHSVVGRAHFAL